MHQKQASSQKLSLGGAYSKATPLAQKQNFAWNPKGSAQPFEKLQSHSIPIGQPKPHGNVYYTTLKLKSARPMQR
jgi:hypothetical protein